MFFCNFFFSFRALRFRLTLKHIKFVFGFTAVSVSDSVSLSLTSAVSIVVVAAYFPTIIKVKKK